MQGGGALGALSAPRYHDPAGASRGAIGLHLPDHEPRPGNRRRQAAFGWAWRRERGGASRRHGHTTRARASRPRGSDKHAPLPQARAKRAQPLSGTQGGRRVPCGAAGRRDLTARASWRCPRRKLVWARDLRHVAGLGERACARARAHTPARGPGTPAELQAELSCRAGAAWRALLAGAQHCLNNPCKSIPARRPCPAPNWGRRDGGPRGGGCGYLFHGSIFFTEHVAGRCASRSNRCWFYTPRRTCVVNPFLRLKGVE